MAVTEHRQYGFFNDDNFSVHFITTANFILKSSQLMQDSHNFCAAALHCCICNICAYDYANEHSYMIVLYGHLSFCVKSVEAVSADLSLGCHFDEFINSCLHSRSAPFLMMGSLWHHVENFLPFKRPRSSQSFDAHPTRRLSNFMMEDC